MRHENTDETAPSMQRKDERMTNTWHQQIIRVHYKDTDQMGVAHHANYVSWFEVGRTEWMRNAGIAYSRMESEGLLLPVVDMNVQYHKPAKYDDIIAVFTNITDVSAVRLRFNYEVRRMAESQSFTNTEVASPHGELLTSGSTLHMWSNSAWKPARINKIAPEVYALLQSKSAQQEA